LSGDGRVVTIVAVMEPPATFEFSSPRPNLIVSRNGFAVGVAHSVIRYEEAGKVMEIFAEWLATAEAQIIIRRHDVRAWEGPVGQIEVEESERARIVANIHRALAFKGWLLVVEE
jgi:Immunity protein 74